MDHGVKAKNARTRAESADELGVLIQRHGESVLQPGKALPALGSLVADRDSSARSAAISTIAIVYNLHGDLIFDYLGGLSAKDRGMLDEKLKRTAAAPTSPDRPSTPSSKVPAASARKSLRPASSRLSLGGASGIPPGLKSTNGPASHGKEAPRQLAPAPTISETKPRRSLIPPSTSKHSHLTPAPIKEAPVEEAPAPVSFNQIVNQNPVSSVDALKTVQKDIDRRASEVMPMADDLVGAVTLQMRTAFDGLDPSSSSSTLRLCKHLMQTLSAFFDNRALAKEVSRDALVSLLAELTRRLLETADNTASEAIVSLSKVGTVCQGIQRCQLNILARFSIWCLSESSTIRKEARVLGLLLDVRSQFPFADLLSTGLSSQSWKMSRLISVTLRAEICNSDQSMQNWS